MIVFGTKTLGRPGTMWLTIVDTNFHICGVAVAWLDESPKEMGWSQLLASWKRRNGDGKLPCVVLKRRPYHCMVP